MTEARVVVDAYIKKQTGRDVVGLGLEPHAAVLAGGHIEDVVPWTPNRSSARGHDRPRNGDGPQAHVECANVKACQEKELGRR